MAEKKRAFPPQHQDRQPGLQSEMEPKPKTTDRAYKAAGKLQGKVALVTGGDSGIGRAVAVHYAKEGADVAVAYLNEGEDAETTRRLIEDEGRRALLLSGDVGNKPFCEAAVRRTLRELGRLDVLVNNAAEQHWRESVRDVEPDELERTFRTNLFAQLYLVQAALPHLTEGASVINTTSITAYKGNPKLLDYTMTKGAIVAFTRSLSQELAEKGIRVNAVAPGPVWTPLIPASFPAEEVESFGADYPMGHAAQPEEIAPTYVFLACDDSSPYTGQVFHPNMGKIVGS